LFKGKGEENPRQNCPKGKAFGNGKINSGGEKATWYCCIPFLEEIGGESEKVHKKGGRGSGSAIWRNVKSKRADREGIGAREKRIVNGIERKKTKGMVKEKYCGLKKIPGVTKLAIREGGSEKKRKITELAKGKKWVKKERSG